MLLYENIPQITYYKTYKNKLKKNNNIFGFKILKKYIKKTNS